MSDLGPVEDRRAAIDHRVAEPVRTDEAIRGAKRSNGAFLWVVAIAVISGVGASVLLIDQTKSVSDRQMAVAEDRGRAEAMGDQALATQQNAQRAQQAATQMSPAYPAADDRTAAEAAADRPAASAEQSGQDASATVPAPKAQSAPAA
jgi:hypothetical protein